MSKNSSGSLSSGRGLWFFSAAGLVGLVAGLWIALAPGDLTQMALPVDGPSAARVNGVAITMLEFERAAQAVQNDRRNALGPDEAARVLDTLINEELLAQEAVRLGLVSSDREVRSAAVRGVMRLILSDLASVEPSESDLRAFYDDHPNLFARPGQVWVRHLEIPAAYDDEVAAIADALREGESFRGIRIAFPNASSRPVPDRPLRAEDMSQYLGGELTELALAASEGTVMGPLVLGERAHFLWVVEREDGERPSFAEVREDLIAEWRRRAEETAVQIYVDRIRARSSIEIEALPE